ncbi:uncharacterized protein LOC141655201 [Silene latifolia]|uniref:uncharacterized protein LOC141655201 n=1 Tax=Silene latifolia TaxID=37657 RepID=UPI003D7782F9
MRQRRWMKLIGDYDMDIIYHEGKANVVDDTLSRKSVHSLCTVMSLMRLKDEVTKMGIHVIQKEVARRDLKVEPDLYDDIRRKQALDPKIQEWRRRVKGEQRRPQGKIQSLEVTEWKWESISLDFIVGLTRTPQGNNMIWVIVDPLTKSAHFIPMKYTWSKAQLANGYKKNVVRLHGVPKDIL